jgi:hypothetical protein
MLYAFNASCSSYIAPPRLEQGDSVPEIYGQLVLAPLGSRETVDFFTSSDSK